MSRITDTIARWFGFGAALSTDVPGAQTLTPVRPVFETPAGDPVDRSLAISAVWGCVDLLTKTIATLPLFLYEGAGDRRTLARGDPLYVLLHDRPNRLMTPKDFWTAVLLNRFLRGNGYARIERNARGQAIALWPMSADQVTPVVNDAGELFYHYTTSTGTAVYRDADVLHIKGMGPGLVGLAPLDYMRATTVEATYAQEHAATLFANGDKPAGLLIAPDGRVLNKEQRAAALAQFAGIANGAQQRLHLLEGGFRFEPVSLRPEDVQLLETRRFSVEEIARWYGVPAVLLNHANVTTWGSGVEQLLQGFYKLTIRPELEGIEQAIAQRVFTDAERARFQAEFNFEGLLRGSAAERFALYATAVQNGVMTRAEARQLENLPPIDGSDELTAQANLVPLAKLGQSGASQSGESNAGTQSNVAQ